MILGLVPFTAKADHGAVWRVSDENREVISVTIIEFFPSQQENMMLCRALREEFLDMVDHIEPKLDWTISCTPERNLVATK